MTSLVNNFTLTALATNDYNSLSVGIGLICILLLVALLIFREVMRTLDPARRDAWAQTLDIAIVPLVIVFGFVVINRLLLLVP